MCLSVGPWACEFALMHELAADERPEDCFIWIFQYMYKTLVMNSLENLQFGGFLQLDDTAQVREHDFF